MVEEGFHAHIFHIDELSEEPLRAIATTLPLLIKVLLMWHACDEFESNSIGLVLLILHRSSLSTTLGFRSWNHAFEISIGDKRDSIHER